MYFPHSKPELLLYSHSSKREAPNKVDEERVEAPCKQKLCRNQSSAAPLFGGTPGLNFVAPLTLQHLKETAVHLERQSFRRA
jgi:hypothetical protein